MASQFPGPSEIQDSNAPLTSSGPTNPVNTSPPMGQTEERPPHVPRRSPQEHQHLSSQRPKGLKRQEIN